MKKRKARKIFLIIISLALFVYALPVSAITSRGACAIDVTTGETVYEHNADEPLAPASMTKFMTVYIVFDKMREGNFSKDTLITCSKDAAAFSVKPGASNIPLAANEKYSVDELIGAALVPSACSAAYLMAEYIAGSQEEFVKLMNNYVYKLGLEAYYADSTGLSNSNRISARSMATLAAKAVNEFPEILDYTSRPYITVHGTRYRNTNNLLPGKIYEYKGADGLKTGTTDLAGYCITATAERDGMRVVGVTMKSTSADSRYTDIHDILNAGFKKADTLRPKVLADTTKIYIDGAEIPSLYANTEQPETVIFAEHLENFGFDINYDAENRIVYLTKNTEKSFSPMDADIYNDYSHSIHQNSSLKVILTDSEKSYEFERVYDLSGYAAIPTAELEGLYEYNWSSEEMSGYFVITDKTAR